MGFGPLSPHGFGGLGQLKRAVFQTQALPRDGKPAVSWDDLDEALAGVAEGLRVAAEGVLASR